MNDYERLRTTTNDYERLRTTTNDYERLHPDPKASCTRAPPESLMKTNGEPVFNECIMISATLIECTSPAAPPATVKSWLARWISRPATDAAPVASPAVGA